MIFTTKRIVIKAIKEKVESAAVLARTVITCSVVCLFVLKITAMLLLRY